MNLEGEPVADERPPLVVQTRYDRFPATVKGAFVLRGGDAYPHTARLVSAALARVPGGSAKEVPMGDLQVDIAPARDLFVPFEAGTADLDPGWYVIASEVLVDGSLVMAGASRPFSVPWPRGEVRTGSLPLAASATAGGASFRADRVDLKTDRSVVVWREEAGAVEGVEVRLAADGRPLDPVPGPAGPEGRSGDRKALFYPVPRSARDIEVTFALPGGESGSLRGRLD
jgi:hypothetical protein